MPADKLLAALALVVCAVMLLRMILGARQRARMDQAAWRCWQVTRRWAQALWHWRARRTHARDTAAAMIRRAQTKKSTGQWEGNVYRPKEFGEPGAQRPASGHSADDPSDAPPPKRDLH
jgi:hypothetical protein